MHITGFAHILQSWCILLLHCWQLACLNHLFIVSVLTLIQFPEMWHKCTNLKVEHMTCLVFGFGWLWLFVMGRPQRVNHSPGPQPPAGRNSPGNAVTSMVRMNLAVGVNVVSCLLNALLCCSLAVVSIIYTHFCNSQNVCNQGENQRWRIPSFWCKGDNCTLTRWSVLLKLHISHVFFWLIDQT